MKKTILAIVIGLLFASGIVIAQMGGGISTPNFWKLTGDDISPISDDWNVVMGNVTIGGVTTGDIDMGEDLILNIGATGTDFIAGGGLDLAGAFHGFTIATIDGVAYFNSTVDIADTLTATGSVYLATTSVSGDLTVLGTTSLAAVSITDLTLSGDLDVTGTSSFVGIVDLTSDLTVGGDLTVTGNMYTGSMEFTEDSGLVVALDMSVSDVVATGTIEGYTFAMDGTDILVIYSEADGSGQVENTRVGIGELTPTTTLDVAGQIRALDSTSTTCDASLAGAIIYDAIDDHFYGCTIVGGWKQLDGTIFE